LTEKLLNLPLNNCEVCPLLKEGSYNPHNYWGNLDHPDVLFVGEAPGKTEKATGKVFQGRAGKKLISNLKAIGIDNFAMTNVVACRPEVIDKSGFEEKIKDRKPSPTEIKHCAENLDAIIAQVKPKFIVALGATAMQRFKITGGITNNRGSFFDTSYGKVLPIFHPAYILRSPNFEIEFKQDLEKLKSAIETGDITRSKPTGNYIVIEEIEDVEILEKELSSAKVFAFDIESTGLRFYKDKIMGIGFCAKEGLAYYIPLLESRTLKQYWGEEQGLVIDTLSRIMSDPKPAKIAHNGKFDIKFIQHHWNIKVRNFAIDTMLLHYLLDENRPHGLKGLAGFYFPEMKDYDLELRDSLKVKDMDDETFGNVPLEILGPYCAMDCETTYRLAKILIPELKKFPKLQKLFFDLYMPLSKVYTEAELLGVKIDVKYIHQITKESKAKIRRLQRKIFEVAGEEFNLNSPKQLIEILFTKLQFPILLKTASGNPSTAEAALKAIQGKRLKNKKIIDWILEYRGLNKMTSTYLEPMVNRADEHDRIHPSFLLHGTVTGRVSSKDPNIQNIPRDPRIKGMFIPEEGYHFVEMDFSQAELRVMAYYSKDVVMTKQYEQGEDIHLSTACFIFKLKPEEITKRQRKIAKLVNFGYLYGASAKKAHQSITEKMQGDETGITQREAQLFRDRFFQQYAGIDRFIKKSRSLIKREKQIENCFGRIRRLPQIDSPYEEKIAEAMRQGLNALIQGTASDLTQIALIKIHKFLIPYKSRFLFTVHDAIVLEVHESELHLLPILKKIMEEKRKPFNFPIEADIEQYKRRWGND